MAWMASRSVCSGSPRTHASTSASVRRSTGGTPGSPQRACTHVPASLRVQPSRRSVQPQVAGTVGVLAAAVSSEWGVSAVAVSAARTAS